MSKAFKVVNKMFRQNHRNLTEHLNRILLTKTTNLNRILVSHAHR